MLAYLVKSSGRRRLLELLWRHDVSGSCTELAKRARVGFATAYRELKQLEAFGLVTSQVTKGREEYAAAANHPNADLMRLLVSAPSVSASPSDTDAEQTRRRLRALGAPLPVSAAMVADEERERALVEGVRLAHHDTALARALPVALWRQWKTVDRARLKQAARRARETHALGFVASLTSDLSGDRSLGEWAEGLRDYRVSTLRPFFDLPSTRTGRASLERRTPAVARRWNYLMDLDYQSFEDTFQKASVNETA